jgi:hypothetical protein
MEDNKLGQTVVWTGCYCGDQIGYQNRMSWERDIFGPKEYCEEEFGPLQFKLKKLLN